MLNEQLKIPNHIQIVAVSKLQPIEKIRHLIDEGHFIFGENYVQEAIDKMNQLNNQKLEWHFIGTLQKNKVKLVVGQFAYIHSVDSLGLLQKIQQIALEKKVIQKIFLQINVAKETSKGGFAPSELVHILNEIKNYNHIEVVGLMTMPPLTENPEDVRPYFRELKSLGEKYFSRPIQYSMGTSHDYQVALSEGATMIRLGTILFGDRPRKG